MNDATVAQVKPRAEIISALRALAIEGKCVPEFAAEVRTQLQCKDSGTFSVMSYLRNAFSLRVADVLPIQAWICGAQTDEEINSLILPRIKVARAKWLQADDAGGAPRKKVSGTFSGQSGEKGS